MRAVNVYCTWSWYRTFVLVFGFAAVFSLASLAPAQKDQDGVDVKSAQAKIKEFKKFFGNSNEYVRKAAVEDLGECNHALCAKPLLAALSDKSDEVRSVVIPALRKQTTPAASHFLNRELAKQRKVEAQIAIMEVFRVTRPKVAFPTILKIAGNKKFASRVVAAEILGLYPAEVKKSAGLLLEMLRDANPQIRLIAIDALVKLQHAKLVDICLGLLKTEKDWRVKASAIAAIPPFRQKRTIEPLIRVFETEKGRLFDDTYRALLEITGEAYRPRPTRWRKWWKNNQKHFKVPTLAEMTARRKKQKASMAAYASGSTDKPPFHGINTKSKRMLFLLDVSFSMVDKVVMSTKDPRKAEAFKLRYGGYNTKVELAREELIRYVATLEPHVKFNIILFSSVIKPWKSNLVSANSGNRNSALKMLSRITPDWIAANTNAGHGGTNTFGALNLALGLKDKPQKKPSKNHKVEGDTVFFMTDGMPEIGLITDPNELVEYVLEVNKRAKIVFHTLTFDQGNANFLKRLADGTGGQYVVIGG